MIHLECERASVILPKRALSLINLSGKALHKLGIPRAQLLESEAADHPGTRPWAQALHEQFPAVDGLQWVSRQDDEAHALLLFGDRVKKADLQVVHRSMDIVNDLELYLRLLNLAQLVGVRFL